MWRIEEIKSFEADFSESIFDKSGNLTAVALCLF